MLVCQPAAAPSAEACATASVDLAARLTEAQSDPKLDLTLKRYRAGGGERARSVMVDNARLMGDADIDAVVAFVSSMSRPRFLGERSFQALGSSGRLQALRKMLLHGNGCSSGVARQQRRQNHAVLAQ